MGGISLIWRKNNRYPFMASKETPSDQPSPKPPQPGATQHLGYPPGYVPPTGAAPQGNLGYPVQPGMMPPGYPPQGAGHLGYPVAPGYPMQQPGMPVPAMPVPTATSSVPVLRAVEDEDVVAAAEYQEEPIFQPLTHIEPAKRPNALFRTWAKIGGGSLALSIAIHAGIFIAAGLIILIPQMKEKQVDFLPGGTAKGAAASSDMKHKVQQKTRNKINKPTAMKKIVSINSSSAVTLPDAPVDPLDVPDMSAMMGGGSLSGKGLAKMSMGGGFGTKGAGIGAMQGFVSLPPSMRSRCSPQERLQKLGENGGNAECERAVSQSLEWLKQKQNPDGSWPGPNKAAMTGMALLCFLGRCETPESPFYGDTVMKGIMYLIELSKKNQYGYIDEDIKENGSTYAHGIATYSLGEMYTLSRLGSKELPGMRDAFEKGVKLIIENQNKRGSWSYGGIDAGKPYAYNKDSTGEDLSVAGWQFQALKAAKNSGLKIDGLHSAIDKCTDYVISKQTVDGGFGTTDRDKGYNQWSLTGAGSLALQTMSKGKSVNIKKAITFLHSFLQAEPLDWNKNCNLYCWYYYTQTFFQAGGDEWKFYNQQFLPQILAAQQPDGSFKKGRPNMPIADAADPVYRQVLCTLQLEVYYRYLKVADRDEESFFER